MHIGRLSGVSLTALTLGTGAALAQGFEVTHHYTSETEAAAIRVLADAFAAEGGEWVDNAIAGPPNTRRVYTTQMQAGQPAGAYSTVTNRDHYDFIAQGWLTSIEAAAEAGDWRANMPEALIASMSGEDGQIYTAPLALYTPNMVFYNVEVFDRLGLEEPVGFGDDFFAALDAIEADGLIPLAFSGDAFHIRFPFEAILLERGGPELWQQVWGERSLEAIEGPEMRETFEILGRMRDYADPGNIGLAWNLATNQVASGQAGVQIMGSWSDGEYRAAGGVAGEDYGCYIPGERDYMQLHSDVMVFPQQPGTDGATEDQLLFASLIGDPALETEYVAPRGALPPRTDAELPEGASRCLEIGYEAFNTEGNLVPNPRSLITSQMDGEYRDGVIEFWSNPDITVDEAIDDFANALEAD